MAIIDTMKIERKRQAAKKAKREKKKEAKVRIKVTLAKRDAEIKQLRGQLLAVGEEPLGAVAKATVISAGARRRASRRGFYDTPEWREVRYQALKLHGGACQLCGATRAHGAILHVDHIKPRSKYPELQLDINNLQVLCEACNLGKSNKDDTDWR